MNALAIHLYLMIRYINLSFNYFGNFYRIIVKLLYLCQKYNFAEFVRIILAEFHYAVLPHISSGAAMYQQHDDASESMTDVSSV